MPALVEPGLKVIQDQEYVGIRHVMFDGRPCGTILHRDKGKRQINIRGHVRTLDNEGALRQFVEELSIRLIASRQAAPLAISQH